MPRTLFSADFDNFTGSGLGTGPGQLDPDTWTFGGFSSDSDLSRGTTDGGERTGGVYALTQGGGDTALWIQPGGSDFTPGFVALSFDTGGMAATGVRMTFDRLVLNDQDRANAFDLELSVGGGAFVPLDSFTSPLAADAAPAIVTQSVAVSLPDLAADTQVTLRWTGDDVDGGGARDEFGLDDITVTADEGTGGNGGGGTPTAPDVVVNAVLANTTGRPDAEYVELFGAPGTSLAGLSFVAVEGEDNGNLGTFNLRYDFADGDALGDNGFFLLANQTAVAAFGVTPDRDLAGELQNGSATYALVRTDSLSDGGVTGAEVVLDAVAALSDAADADRVFFGAPAIGPDGRFLPPGVRRAEDGVDTDAASDFVQLDFGNDPATNTPTAGGTGDTGGGGGDVTIDDAATVISAIQGTEDRAALVGRTVVVEAVVTGDFQDGDGDPLRDLGGFFVMEEAADRDGDAATSEGLFVEDPDGALTDVAEGQTVRVLGTVREVFGRTVLEAAEIRVTDAPAVDPLSLAVETALPGVADREAFESMLVTVTESLTFSESFDYEQFNTATLSTDGIVYQFSQRNAPDAAANAAYQAEVADRTILIEDGLDGRRRDLDPIPEPDGDPIGDPATAPRMGQSTTGLTAIVDYGFGDFRLRVPDASGFALDADTNPVPDMPLTVGSAYKVASFNVLNYFTTLDADGMLTDIGAGPRGAESAEELARQQDKLVTALLALDSDVIGLIEIENDFAGDSFAIRTLVDALNVEAGAGTWNFVDPGQEFVGGDAIAVAFIYDTTTTGLRGDAAVLDTDAFLDPLGDATTNGDAFNRAALAQTFTDLGSGGSFVASVNHFKSKGSATGAAADEDAGDGAGRGNATRAEAARELADWLAGDPTGSGDDDVLILGDLNAYAREEPIQVLEGAGYTDLARSFEGEDVYSYRFSGQVGTLDYALANEALTGQVTGATTWTINSDTPVYHDYNLEATFGRPVLRPTDQGLFDGDSPLRSSDHDPVIVGLALDDDRIVLAGDAGFDRLNGTDADEIIDGGGGRIDVVFGGGGADTFVFTDIDGSRDGLRIMDFDTAEDVLDLGGATIASARALGSSLRIALDGEDGDSVTLLGVTDIDAIVFADPIGLA
ncbi:ExeM/NucH family extracellular endonuclease [Jannaschia sp. LMIT008]|uniref:ExeM/NucH family extracellular endonuclease n=1 Tax=Jannaschia maritima TaxID=3032585 RepID=UPI00281183EB|nr:ExeM/NucH family extracellular endonuclease [Jannaschia sp. LMIT008]